MATGRFISFEGIDGAGKTTQIDGLERLIRAAGHEVVRTREPGGTPLGEKIRGLLLTDEMTPRTETLLFFAARCEHAEKVIKPALERGAWVLSDRFTDATYAYQTGGKGMKGEDVEALEAWTLAGFAPDVTVLFDLAPEVAARRRTIRAGEGDRFERESADFFAAFKLEGDDVEFVLGKSFPFRGLDGDRSAGGTLAVYNSRDQSLSSDSACFRAAFDGTVAHIEHMLYFVCHSCSFRL